jgi:hypothetical protein
VRIICRYWEHFPASDQLNPAGFFSPHPLWESFAKPAKVGKKNAFHCEFCKKTFIGAADKGVNHMLKKKGCLIPDVNKQALVDKLAAYRKRKQEHMKRRKPEKNWYVALWSTSLLMIYIQNIYIKLFFLLRNLAPYCSSPEKLC